MSHEIKSGDMRVWSWLPTLQAFSEPRPHAVFIVTGVHESHAFIKHLSSSKRVELTGHVRDWFSIHVLMRDSKLISGGCG